MRPQPMDPSREAQCPCRTQVKPDATMVEGHVLSTKPEELASPYLQDILCKGKKYRLKQPVHSILARLDEGLSQYVEWKRNALSRRSTERLASSPSTPRTGTVGACGELVGGHR